MTDITIKIKATYTQELKSVTVKSDGKVEDIMKEIEKYSNIPPSDQKLIFKGKILKPEEPLSTYKIENDCQIIFVKTFKDNQNPQPVPSANVSGNPSDNITIKVKTNLDASVHTITINKNATVLGLKGEIEKLTHVSPAQQKLIVKGKTMKDSDPLSSYELNNESTVAMIKQNGPAPSGGAPGSGLGGLPNMGQMGQMMGDPRYQQTMNNILNDPRSLEMILNSPEIRPLLEQNPQLRAMLQNPQARQLLLNPQLLQRVGGLGGGLGGLGNLSGLSPSNTPNTRLGDLFTQWMDGQRGSSGSQPPRQEQPRIPQPNPQPVFQPVPQPDPNVDYKEKYKEQIAQIKDMGIDDEEKIIDALKKCDGNVQYALNRLFG